MIHQLHMSCATTACNHWPAWVSTCAAGLHAAEKAPHTRLHSTLGCLRHVRLMLPCLGQMTVKAGQDHWQGGNHLPVLPGPLYPEGFLLQPHVWLTAGQTTAWSCSASLCLAAALPQLSFATQSQSASQAVPISCTAPAELCNAVTGC